MAGKPEWARWTKQNSVVQLGELKQVRPECRLVTMYNELPRLQHKNNYAFNVCPL